MKTFDCRFEEHVRPVLGLTFLDYSYTAVSMDTQQTIVSIYDKLCVPLFGEALSGKSEVHQLKVKAKALIVDR